MGEVKSLFQKDSECMYVPGMDAELKYDNKARDMMTAHFMDGIMVTGDIFKTDYFYLRAVLFLRIANAEMVAEYLRYFRNYYGNEECMNLLLPKNAYYGDDLLSAKENWNHFVTDTRKKLLRLARRYLIYAVHVTTGDEEREFKDVVFCANATTFSLVRTIFGETPCFGYGNLVYEKFYCMTPIQKMMETMHACRVGVLAFTNHKNKVLLRRENEIIYGSKKEKFASIMRADIQCNGYLYKILIEPVHFTVDERLLTKMEHKKNIERFIASIGRMISHFDYIESNFKDKPLTEKVRFILVVENVEGMRQLIRMMDPYREKYSGKVFFTTDTFLLGTNCLKDAIFMAKEMPEEERLGLIRPTDPTIKVTQNEWIYEDMTDL